MRICDSVPLRKTLFVGHVTSGSYNSKIQNYGVGSNGIESLVVMSRKLLVVVTRENPGKKLAQHKL